MDQEMILSQAMLLLRDAGVRISGGNLAALSLALPDRRTLEVRVQIADAPPTPSKLELILARPQRTLLITSRPGKAAVVAAAHNMLDLITVTPASVTLGGTRLLEPHEPAENERPHGRTPWGRWAMLRALALANGPMTQQELADAAGISQPAVFKHLKTLTPFVDRDQDGWRAHSVQDILSEWINRYPGPRGASTYWYSLKSPHEQAEAAASFAQEMGAAPLVSGDAAADIYAPWRLPDSVHLYLRAAVDFTDAGFTPASRDEATLIATIPEDPTLWPTAALSQRSDMPLADPLVTWRDVLAGDASDSREAAEHLRDAIADGAAR